MTLIKCKPDVVIFTNYKPVELQMCSLKDLRFKKPPIWSNEQLKLNNSELYSKKLLDEFNRILEAAKSFLEGNSLKEVSKKHNLSVFVIKRITGEIIAGKKIDKILNTHIKYNETLGLDLASVKLIIYQNKNKRTPITTDKDMGDLVNAVYKGYWKKNGINSWNELLEHVFGKEQLEKWDEYDREQKLNQAVITLKKFFRKNQRFPKFIDKEVREVINLIRTGIWSKYGIGSWNDMLSHVFDDVNSESKKYVGSHGLETAMKELREDYKKEGKLPVYDNYVGITCAIRRGYWNELGINTWNDLLTQIFGEINFINNKYKGAEGFRLAVHVLKDFEKINGRRPNNKDKGISGIRSAIYRGEWRFKGINTWKDMIIYVFGESKSRWERYTGKDGLEFAVSKLRLFKNKNQRVPKVRDKGLSGIKGAVYRGEWQTYGINNWNDLILYAFREIE